MVPMQILDTTSGLRPRRWLCMATSPGIGAGLIAHLSGRPADKRHYRGWQASHSRAESLRWEFGSGTDGGGDHERGLRGQPAGPVGLLDALHGQPPVQRRSAPPRRGQRHVLPHRRRRQRAGRHRGPVVLQPGPCPGGDHRGRRPAARHPGLRPDLPDGTSPALPPGGGPGGVRTARTGPDLLHQLGFGVRRHGPEDGPGLSPRPGRGAEGAPDRAGEGLSRRRLRRDFRGRPGQQPADLSHPPGGGPHRPHLRPREERLLPGPAGPRGGEGRRGRAAGGPAWRRDHRRGHR